ncbi:transcriptional regulator domain-containing protein [Gluconacetobacter azotocaptans]|uniref:transcriptional regulator domain-containing protein n=1 Tax=Gluconacetobacter azotocaptans TaxID=142834 RepID=UPI003571789A
MVWEYLRGDDDYRRAFQRTKKLPAPKFGGSEAFSERWGLQFPATDTGPAYPDAPSV